jgi:hypothetical protein
MSLDEVERRFGNGADVVTTGTGVRIWSEGFEVTSWEPLDWMSLDEARARGVPEEILAAAKREADGWARRESVDTS